MEKENTTRYILLGLLSHEDMSGYDMKKRIDIMVSQFWNVGFGQIYPTLSALAREGLVTKATAAGRGPERYVYSITDAGRQALATWLALPEEREYTRYELLLKLFFSGRAPAEQNIARIREFRERHAQNLAMITLFEGNLLEVLDSEPDHLNYYLTTLFGEHVYKAYLAWADEALRLLAESGPQRPEVDPPAQ